MQIGIIGLPYSGKTTLFNILAKSDDDKLLTKKSIDQALIKVPDKRLDKLRAIFQPRKQVNATLEIMDIKGIQGTEDFKAHFTTQFLTRAKYNDAFLVVLRAFKDEAVPYIFETFDPIRDFNLFNDEFILNDLGFVESRIEKLDKELMKQKNKDEVIRELNIMNKWNELLSQGIALKDIEPTTEEVKYFKNYQPLTAKPLIIAVNMSDEDIANKDEILKPIYEAVKSKNVVIEPLFARIEKELSELDENEKLPFMQEFGLQESPLNRMIRSIYHLLGLRSFFTLSEDECRAWTIKDGMNAQESAGVIHTDFYNKFIRAEVVNFDDFIACGSMAKCREKGLIRLEGKDYIVNDGDIINIRHG